MKTNYAIGVDLGGTKIAAGIVSSKGDILSEERVSTPKKQKHIIDAIISITEKVWDKRAGAIGVGVPGHADETGNVSGLTNIAGWKKTNIADILCKRFRVPVAIANDADCFTLAESVFGKAGDIGSRVLVGITLGTGVGGGIVFNGSLYRGTGGGIEIGHMPLDPSGPRSHTKIKGSLESWCSGPGLEAIYKSRTGKKVKAIDIDKLGTKAAEETIKIASEKLAEGLAGVINIINPDCIAIGGGASRIKGYVRPALKRMKELCYPANKKITAYISTKSSGVLGAASLVL